MFSYEQDVLWNIDPDAPDEKYISEVITLVVKRIFPKNPPSRMFIHPDDNGRTVKMTLIHDPVPCNYSHSMAVFEIGDVPVMKFNYKETFDTKPFKRLRQVCRDELKNAILRKEIDI